MESRVAAIAAAVEVLDVGIFTAVRDNPPCLPHREIEERGMTIEKMEAPPVAAVVAVVVAAVVEPLMA